MSVFEVSETKAGKVLKCDPSYLDFSYALEDYWKAKVFDEYMHEDEVKKGDLKVEDHNLSDISLKKEWHHTFGKALHDYYHLQIGSTEGKARVDYLIEFEDWQSRFEVVQDEHEGKQFSDTLETFLPYFVKDVRPTILAHFI